MGDEYTVISLLLSWAGGFSWCSYI